MKKHEADRLIAVIKELAEDGAKPTPTKIPTPEVVREDIAGERSRIDAAQMERIYQEIKKRLLDELPTDPVALQLLTTRPEIVLEIEPRVVTLSDQQLKGRVARLLAAGWFKDARATSAVRRELARTGADPGGGGTLSDKLSELQREGFLTREGEGWIGAPNIKVTEKTIERVS